MYNKELSPYRVCNECHYVFKLPFIVRKVESKDNKLKIFCPRCENSNTGIIDISQYLGEIKHLRGKPYGKI